MNTKPFFDSNSFFIGSFPKKCVEECAASGDCTDAVQFWQNKLDFTVPRENAMAYLIRSGGWSFEELHALNDTEIAEKILWMACGEIKESGEWYGLIS